MKSKFAFVILNYKTVSDTISLLKNLKGQSWSDNIKIYVVDNASGDDSVIKLNVIKREISFELIESDRNLGFAEGNNLGIKRATEDGYTFIVCSNSDINIKKQDNFLNIIYNLYVKNSSIAIIAPNIINNDNIFQNPFRKERFNKKEIIKMKLFYLTGFYKLYYFFRVYIFYNLITHLARNRYNKKKIFFQNTDIPNSGYIYAPHGSFLIFTPKFFKYFSGFDSKTFLYCEEFILAEKLRQNNLKCWYENTLKVLHKESQSTEKIINNYKDKVKFTLKHTFSSCKYFAKIIKIR